MADILRKAEQNIRANVDAKASNVVVPDDIDGGDLSDATKVDVDQKVVDDINSDVDDGLSVDTSGQSVSLQQDDSADDDSWIDALEPYDAGNVTGNVTGNVGGDTESLSPSNTDEGSTNGFSKSSEGTDSLYDDLQHLDAEVAAEIKQRFLDPQLTELKAKLSALEKEKERERQAKQKELINSVNKELFTFNPKVDKVLISKEFKEFVDASTSPYAKESNYDVLTRAYYAGDAKYVLNTLQSFFDSKRKPKPSVGVEVPKGSTSNSAISNKKEKRMTQDEYRRKRAEILSAPKGKYPPGALRELSDRFFKHGG